MKRILFTLLVLLTISAVHGQRTPVTFPGNTDLTLQLDGNRQLIPNRPFAYFDSSLKKRMLYYPNSGVKDPYEIPLKLESKQNGTASRSTTFSNFSIVKDINTSKDANPSNENLNNSLQSFAVLNNVAYYAADDGIDGVELWKSDGTAKGTTLVKDINPGPGSSNVREIIVADDKLFFTAYTEVNGYELWVSNGTANGTKLVKDIVAGITGSAPSNLINLKGKAFFVVNNIFPQLWKSDGTAAGTSIVKDFGSGMFAYDPDQFTVVNDLLYFTSTTVKTGTELWRSDGKTGGTYMVKNIYPGSYSAAPANLTSYSNKLYFSADDGNGRKLWVSTDGTDNGTTLVNGNNNITVDLDYSHLSTPFSVSNSNIYFPGYTPQTGWELYKYNETNPAGVVLVKDITPGGGSTKLFPADLRDVDNTLYFAFSDSVQNMHLWKSDGTTAATMEVTNLGKVDYYNLFNGNGKLLFDVRTDSTGNELWKSEGTAASTHIVKNIYEGAVSSFPDNNTVCNGFVLFKANNERTGVELWKTDGSTAGTTIVKDVNKTATANSSPQYITLNNNNVFFSAFTADRGNELWKSDGTAAGTSLVKQIIPGENSTNPHYITSKNNFVYFVAPSGSGNALYKTDGTSSGTKIIVDAPDGFPSSYIVTNNGTIFYNIRNYKSNSNQLWKTDGTVAGTVMLSNHLQTSYEDYDPEKSAFNGLVSIGKSIYFTAFDAGTGFELFKSNGTVAGTEVVKDINPAGSSFAQKLVVYNNNIYFMADDGSGNALWKSDGSAGGTIKLKDIEINSFCISNNLLFFIGLNSQTRKGEVWVTDGSVQGTRLVGVFNNQYGAPLPNNLTDVNGVVYFSAADTAHGTELWKSDGTTANTKLVKDISPGTASSGLSHFAVSASQLFFINDGSLWSSDGTDSGTVSVDDINVGSSFVVNNLKGTEDKLYITGYSYKYGNELYVANTSPSSRAVSDAKNIVVLPQNKFSVDLLKNPINDQLAIRINTGKTQRAQVIVSNPEGKRIVGNSLTILEGNNTFTFNTASWNAGIYFIKIIAEDGSTETLKAMK